MVHSFEMGYGIQPIGYVRCPISSPRDDSWGTVESTLTLTPEFAAGLKGLEEFSHVMVVTYLHGAEFDPARHLQRHPQGRDDMPLVGIFAQRAKDRPNPLGVTCARLLSVSADSIRVRGLDAIDGTPIVDLKPHVPLYDSAEHPQVPEWMGRLMDGYF